MLIDRKHCTCYRGRAPASRQLIDEFSPQQQQRRRRDRRTSVLAHRLETHYPGFLLPQQIQPRRSESERRTDRSVRPASSYLCVWRGGESEPYLEHHSLRANPSCAGRLRWPIHIQGPAGTTKTPHNNANARTPDKPPGGGSAPWPSFLLCLFMRTVVVALFPLLSWCSTRTRTQAGRCDYTVFFECVPVPRFIHSRHGPSTHESNPVGTCTAHPPS